MQYVAMHWTLNPTQDLHTITINAIRKFKAQQSLEQGASGNAYILAKSQSLEEHSDLCGLDQLICVYMQRSNGDM
jgi:hypothetical protein